MEKCGCGAIINGDNRGVQGDIVRYTGIQIAYCPKHSAADELLEATKALLGLVDYMVPSFARDNGLTDERARGDEYFGLQIKVAQKAIQSAGGSK